MVGTTLSSLQENVQQMVVVPFQKEPEKETWNV